MRVLPTLLIAIVLAAGPRGTIASASETCDKSSSSQADLNECYGKAYRKADSELNAIYKQINERLKDRTASAKLLIAAQKAWIAFRDAECNFSTSASAEGSVYPMTQAICLEGLTTKRIDELKNYLGCEEGDLSCPVPAQ
jgi:uncharacterized protein YecT (DUF1311 family)